MSIIESASSLFGSSDSGSDFLTAEEPNSAIDPPFGAEGTTGHEPQGQDASNLFDSANITDNEDSAASLFADAGVDPGASLFDGVVGHGYEEQPQAATEPQAHVYGYDQAPNSDGSYVVSNEGYHQSAAGWYDEHGQWQTANQGGYFDQYGQWQTTDSTYASHAQQQDVSAYGYGAGQASHGSNSSGNYTASVSQAYAYQPTTAYEPATASNSQTQYDPYAPPVPSLSSQTVTASARIASVYDPYKPATTSKPQHSLGRQPTTTHSSYNDYSPQPKDNIPASSSVLAVSETSKHESKPVAALYRPPTSNAYDPPIPSKPKRSMTTNAPRSPMGAFGVYPPLPALDTTPLPRSESVPIPAFGSGLPPAPPRSPSYRSQPPARINTLSPHSGPPRASSPYDPPVTGPYAPSPSLMGTNDPLGRAKARVPVFSFGFGGKLVTCFHTSPAYGTGFDVALSSRKCTDVHIRTLYKIIPESALEVSSAQYPGPLLGDPGSPVSTLMKTATAASAKKSKKSKVIKYLDHRIEETERGVGYLSKKSAARRRAEGKLTLLKLLKVLVEYDGQLRSSQANETAVRAALMPRLSESSDSSGANAYLNEPTAANIALGSSSASSSNERPLAEYIVTPSALNTLQDFLLRGEKRKALHYALDEKLWAHAMIISSSVDKEAFKDVVTEFIRTELGVRAGDAINGFESLCLAYSLYSGQSSSAVQHLFPAKNLEAGPMLTLQPPTPMGNNFMTPLTPNFPSPSQARGIPENVLSKWPEYAVMLFSGQMGPDSSASLTTLGDYLLANDWVEAAHCCYLISPMTSPVNGVGSPSVRMVLVGCQSPHRNTSFATDPDAFIFSEILEYALSLHTPAKGQEPFSGFSHLQVYRLIRALQYADLGHVSLAKRYLDAISGCTARPSPYLTQQVFDFVRDLYGRINGETELIKSGSWITNKIAKPSLNGIGDWLGGSLSKFVAGDDEPQSPGHKEASLSNNPAYAGTFQNFSNISSANTSRGPSPAPSLSQSYGRPSLSMDRSITNASYGRSPSSSFDIDRINTRGTPPLPRTSLDSYATRQSDQGRAGSSYAGSEAEASKQQSGGWWGSAYGDGSGPTPTATSFVAVDGPSTSADSSGFISLMDSVPPFTPSPSVANFTSSRRNDVSGDFDDDLGLGNKRKVEESAEGGEKRVEEQQKVTPAKPDIKPVPSSSSTGSWLGRWFSRTPSNTSSPGPVKANLGEETSFYYDKDMKRWVNKKTGSEPERPAVAPPPPRAQTASPSRAMGSMSHGPPPASPLPPPNRPFSAMDSNFGIGPPSVGPPRKPVHRVPSSLNPDSAKDESLPLTPSTPAAMAHLTAAPPTGRPKSAAKKSVRSRYVDVFQQPQ